ncbi:uroporphyrinogen-III C-methyltransferase [Novosphingobium tardum]|uniref:uroporphyrinogen-III C-methyltransferase n=1 Tax=Novosphingobium tardum TaxID=1538021 RepID=A0ABV8RSS2_9SPHN
MPESRTAAPVWLVGAGPGDPDLLTRKAERLLTSADIVFYDALVGPRILDLAPQAELVCVGKRAGRHSMNQQQINVLIVEAARAGRNVVRLKGGDPAMFGRAMEEMEALHEAGIAACICPGITAASAAAASAGISLSLRCVARRVQFVTAQSRQGDPLDLDWKALADGRSTLAFYMGREAAGEIGARLCEAGLSGATPVLIACNVSLADEQFLHTRLDLLSLATAVFARGLPTLILVGDAVALRNHSVTEFPNGSLLDRTTPT